MMGAAWLRPFGSACGTALATGFAVYKGQDWIEGLAQKNEEKKRQRWASGRQEMQHRELTAALSHLSKESAQEGLWAYSGRFLSEPPPKSAARVLKAVGNCCANAQNGWDVERCRILKDIVGGRPVDGAKKE